MWTFYLALCAWTLVVGIIVFTHVGTLFLIAISIVSGAGTIISAFLTAASLIGIYGYGAIDAIKYFIAVIIFGLISAASFLKFKERKNSTELVRPQTYFKGVAEPIFWVSLIFLIIYPSLFIRDYFLDYGLYEKRDLWPVLAIAFLLCFVAFWILFGAYVFYVNLRHKRERKRMGLD